MTQLKLVPVLLLTMFLTLGSGQNAEAKKPKHMKSKKDATLYDRLGGKGAIKAVVNDFVNNCATDTRINKFFQATASDKARLAKFKNNLVDQICEAAGGPCKYKGKDMKTAHAGMGVKEDDFNALVEDLTKSLDKFKVAEADKNTLLGVLGPMKADIVEAKSAQAEPAGDTPTQQ